MEKNFSRDRLIIFGRYPAPGKTKTRLIPALGPFGSADLQRRLTEVTVHAAQHLAARRRTVIECCFEGGTRQRIRRWLGPVPMVSFQEAGDLGRRMRSAMFNALKAGARRVVLLGTDVPGLNVQILEDAFAALGKHDVVLGPSTDGGYWLLGLKRPVDLFQNIDWSTPRVLEQTLAQTRRLGLTVRLLDPLMDVDTPEDLGRWRPGKDFPDFFLTVVIPTLNEEKYLPRSVIKAISPDVEVIVADGGSTDGTLRKAESLGVRIIQSPLGRARQQNCGAAAARGVNLLFLHADTLLPEGYLTEVFETLMASGMVLGAFRFRTDFRSPYMRLVEWVTHFRSRYLHLPYGDQCIFMKEDRPLRKVGGFPEAPIGEDLLMVRHLIHRENARVIVTRRAAVTSGRRWKRLGPVRTTWINQLMLIGMAMGISPITLSRLYRRAS
jgi:rSAM/selenodomain-associated transferase 2/rSAM/selenodomain-associated transferase 1